MLAKRMVKILVLISVISLMMVVPNLEAQGGVYYVSLTGDDDNIGSESQPFRTVEYAVNSVPTDSTVMVATGDYRYDDSGNIDTENGNVNLQNSNITIEAAPDTKLLSMIISGSNNVVRGFEFGLELECERDGSSIYTDSCDSDPLKPARDTFEYGIRVTGNDNLVENNDIHHTDQDGIWFFGQRNTFRNNNIHDIIWRISDSHNDCFQTWGDAEDILFEGNTCHLPNVIGNDQIVMVENRRSVIRNLTFINNIFIMDRPGHSPMNFHRRDTQQPISNITIVNNTFVHRFSLGQSGIRVTNIDNVTVKNNVFVDYATESTNYITNIDSSNVDSSHNSFFSTDGTTPISGAYPYDVWILDPQFVDLEGLDFHLQPTSPLINAGINQPSVVIDFDGINRPQGNGWDIGAYEYVTSLPPAPSPTPPESISLDSEPKIIRLFDPTISKIGFLQPREVGMSEEQLEWIVIVSNLGHVAGQNVVISDTLIAALQIDHVEASDASVNIAGQTVTVTYAALNPSEAVQFSIFTTVLQGVEVDNVACVTALNQGAIECATGSVIVALPRTGESPFWRRRLWLLLIIPLVGILFVRRKVA